MRPRSIGVARDNFRRHRHDIPSKTPSELSLHRYDGGHPKWTVIDDAAAVSKWECSGSPPGDDFQVRHV
jgi:hypothetical protein